MHFLANENIPLASIVLLRDDGYKVTSIAEKYPGFQDREVLKLAHDKKLIILTFDRDYGELIYRNKLFTPAGVVYFRFDQHDPYEAAKILLEIVKQAKLSIQGKFTVIGRDEIRQRPLLP